MFRFALFAIAAAATLAAAPTISQVVNAAAWLPPDLPNSGVAEGAYFTVKGSQLGPSSGILVSTYPLPTTQGLGGTTATVTVNGITENCIMYYSSNTQVSGIIPSATPVGTGTITVTSTFGTSSAPIAIVKRNFGTFTLNEGGSGPAVITDANYNVITMFNPAYPGEELILWGTGLGPVTGDETEPQTQMDLSTGVQVFVQNQSAEVLYGGRTEFPGEDQINFTVPAGVNGCKVSLAVLVGGITGNVTTISVAPQGQSTCGDTNDDLTQANLQQASSTGHFVIGNVAMSRVAALDDVLVAGYESFTTAQLEASYGGFLGPSLNSCLAYEVSSELLVVTDPQAGTFIPGGASLTLTGPNGSKTMPSTSTGNYSGTLADAPTQFLTPGSFTASNGSGSPSNGVGPFSWNLTLPAYVQPTNMPSTVNLSQNLTLNWSGGSAYPIVSIFGWSYVNISGSQNAWTEFICTAQGSAGTFTVPQAILNLFPANGNALAGTPGIELQIAGVASADFTVTGNPGLSAGVFSALVGNGQAAKIVQ